MKKINISELINHKLSSPIHALKFYSQEKNVNSEDLRVPVEILEKILLESRFINKFLENTNKNWKDFFIYLQKCCYFYSHNDQSLLSVESSTESLIEGTIHHFKIIENLFLNFLYLANIKQSRLIVSLDDIKSPSPIVQCKFSHPIDSKAKLSNLKISKELEKNILLSYDKNNNLKGFSFPKNIFSMDKDND